VNGGVNVRTVTMARILAQQGHYRKAAEIYQYLLQQDPGRTDLVRALEELKRLEPELCRPDLADLLAEWIQLLLRYRRLQDLEAMKKRLSETRSTGNRRWL